MFAETVMRVLMFFRVNFFILGFILAERPKKNSTGLLTWKVINSKMPWGLLFLLGGGFALAEGAKRSGMSEYLGNSLQNLSVLPPLVCLFFVIVFTSVLTEFSSNVAIANIILPVLIEMVSLKICSC